MPHSKSLRHIQKILKKRGNFKMFYLVYRNSCREFKSLEEARLKQIGLTQIGVKSVICNERGEVIVNYTIEVPNFIKAI